MGFFKAQIFVGKIKSDIKEVGRFKVRVDSYAEFIRLEKSNYIFFILSMRGPGIRLCMAKPSSR